MGRKSPDASHSAWEDRPPDRGGGTKGVQSGGVRDLRGRGCNLQRRLRRDDNLQTRPAPLVHACAPGGAFIKHHKRVGPGYPGLGPVSHLGPPSPGTMALLTPPHGYRIPPGPPPYAAAPGTMALLVRPHKQAYDPIAIAGRTLAWHRGGPGPAGAAEGGVARDIVADYGGDSQWGSPLSHGPTRPSVGWS